MKKLLLLLSIYTITAPLLVAENDDYCAQCCAQGRYVDSECGRRCQGCTMRSDEAAQEWRDYPS